MIDLFVKKIVQISQKNISTSFQIIISEAFSFSLKNPEGCRVKEIIGIITLLYEVDSG